MIFWWIGEWDGEDLNNANLSPFEKIANMQNVKFLWKEMQGLKYNPFGYKRIIL